MPRNAQELAESVLSLYDATTNTDEVIQRFYLPDAIFTDPVVHVRGLNNIQAVFRVVPRFVSSSKATLVRGSMAGSSVLTIDSSMVFRMKPFPSLFKVTLRVFTVVELKNGKIASHTDHYDFFSVFANIPIVSFFYNHFRPLFGTTSATIINKLLPPSTSQPTLTAAKTVKKVTAAAATTKAAE